MCQVNNAIMEETYKAEVECLRKLLVEKDKEIAQLKELLKECGNQLYEYSDVCLQEGYQLYTYEWEFYQEPVDWDYIIKNKCLCWFWCDDNDDKYLGTIRFINKNDELPFMNWERGYAKNCRPVRRDEVTFYEDRKDE